MRKKVVYYEEPFCEHCGDLEPFTPTYEEDCSWCIGCGYANGEFTKSEVKKYSKQAAKHKISYYEKRIENLKKEYKL